MDFSFTVSCSKVSDCCNNITRHGNHTSKNAPAQKFTSQVQHPQTNVPAAQKKIRIYNAVIHHLWFHETEHGHTEATEANGLLLLPCARIDQLEPSLDGPRSPRPLVVVAVVVVLGQGGLVQARPSGHAGGPHEPVAELLRALAAKQALHQEADYIEYWHTQVQQQKKTMLPTSAIALILSVMLWDRTTILCSLLDFLKKRAQSRTQSSGLGDTISAKPLGENKAIGLKALELNFYFFVDALRWRSRRWSGCYWEHLGCTLNMDPPAPVLHALVNPAEYGCGLWWPSEQALPLLHGI
jgi:hypothetical protein